MNILLLDRTAVRTLWQIGRFLPHTIDSVTNDHVTLMPVLSPDQSLAIGLHAAEPI